ncbi:MAG: hypothetical protein JZU65_19405 [Chlorobium sp.]|jgi:chromosomal replication initiation ATPase DnaA|nr:hypothetical protein [Chlorobium sp.]
METEVKFLPLTRKEIIFLDNAMRLYRSYDVSNNIRVKIENLKENMSMLNFSPEYIIAMVCELCNITIQEIRGKNRNRKFTEPRSCASVLIKDYHPKMSFSKIGMYLDKDHATIMRHFQNVRDVKEYKTLYTNLKLKIAQV